MANLIPWKNKQRSEGQGDQPLARLRTEVDRLFESFFREPFGALQNAWLERGTWMPSVDVSETEKEVMVRAELPGIDPKDLDVSIVGNELVLSGEKKESSEQKEQGYYHSETRYGSFRRVVPLPPGVDANQVEAKYEHGVLNLGMQKSPDALPEKIEVKAQ
jgi:HSP20 family protein